MSELFFLLFAIFCGFLNCGAGRGFWGYIPKGSKIIFAGGTAVSWGLLTGANIWLVAGAALTVFLWRTPGWGDFFASVHGRKTQWRTTGDSPWAVWMSDKIWNIDPKEGMETRLKATLDMAMRMILIVPVALLAGNYVHVIMFPLLGISYFLHGLWREEGAVPRAEFTNGVIIAAMLWGW